MSGPGSVWVGSGWVNAGGLGPVRRAGRTGLDQVRRGSPYNTREPHQLKWERQLSCKLIICSLEQGPNCIMLLIHLKTTNTLEEVATEAMVDTSATGDFID